MNRERLLTVFLRIVGCVAALAAFCVILPYAWMDAVHRALGLGALPAQPIVGYLARSTSALYALYGVVLLAASVDVIRYRPLLRVIGLATLALGLTLFGVDHVEALPRFWRIGEGSIDVVIGAVIVFLSRPS